MASEELNRENSLPLGELAQAKVRCALNLVLVGLALVAYGYDPSIGIERIAVTFLITASSAAFLYYWASLLQSGRISKNLCVAQRFTSIVLDNVALTWILWFGGETLALIYAIYLWISVGYGVRYGVLYLYGNLAASVTGFSIAAWLSPFWSAHPALTFGLTFALVVIPIYTAYLIRQLHAALAEKEKAYRAKSEFVARMSHELRTPLHGIITATELLSRGPMSTRQHEMSEIVLSSSSHLLALIDEVLDISKYDSSASLPECEMDLYEVIQETRRLVWPHANHKGLAFNVFIDLEINPKLIGSPRQLQEVLVNLLGNAVKFTDVGFVSLRVLAENLTERTVCLRLEVEDSGSGIPEEFLPKLFDRFSQADSSTTRQHSGSGLGTSIVDELVRLMGGTIDVRSREDSGTRFTIRVELPIARSAVPESVPEDVTVAALGFSKADLIRLRQQCSLKILAYDSVDDYLGAAERQEDEDAVLLNADILGLNMRGAVSRIEGARNGTFVPVFAKGTQEFRSAAIIAGCAGYLADNCDEVEIARFSQLVAAMHHPRVFDQPEHKGKGAKLSILVADDNSQNQTIIRMVLEEAGHRCTVVDDGERALDELQSASYDLAILDLHMPRRDGMEVAKIYNFAAFDIDSRTPIIMLTADRRPEALLEAEGVGIDAFLTKPVRPSALLERVSMTAKGSGPRGAYSASYAAIEGRADSAGTKRTELIARSDFVDLMELMGHDARRKFVDEFYEDATTYITSLSPSRLSCGVDGVRQQMHALAGAALTIGAPLLAERARVLELMSPQVLMERQVSEFDEVRDALKLTKTEIERVLAELEQQENDQGRLITNA